MLWWMMLKIACSVTQVVSYNLITVYVEKRKREAMIKKRVGRKPTAAHCIFSSAARQPANS